VFAVPELTVPRLASHSVLSPATLIRTVAADAGCWHHLLRYEPDAPAHVPLPVDHPDVDLWLTGWLPGQSMTMTRRAPGAYTVVTGTIVEFDASGGARLVRAGQTRVFGPGDAYGLANLGEEPATTISCGQDLIIR
jgi:hypothetical protein